MLDRLLELATMRNTYYGNNFRWEDEYNHLKEKIQQAIEKAEKWDSIEDEINRLVEMEKISPLGSHKDQLNKEISILRKLIGKCYCGLEFDKH